MLEWMKIPSPSCKTALSQDAEFLPMQQRRGGCLIVFLVLKGKFPRGLLRLEHQREFESSRGTRVTVGSTARRANNSEFRIELPLTCCLKAKRR